MKRILRILLCICILCIELGMVQAQNTHRINGSVTDQKGESLIGANVFILGTIDGCMTDSNGFFNFTTELKDSVTLVVSYIGYKDCKLTLDVLKMQNLKVILQEKDISIEEVVVVASSFNFGRTGDKLKTMNSLDIVMTGSSNGDIYAALQSLPGTQKVGENGRLYIRGGESEETQTFVNGMHVLVPYTTNAENSVQRSRFSPFLFKGINFTLGGYNGEYGQALSSVLPMETNDVSAGNKLGISFSPFNFNMGGTVAKKKSSISFNGDYMNMLLYNKVFPDKYDWINPYQKISGEMQYKIDFTPQNILKTYVGYDFTTFKQKMEDMFDGHFLRNFSLDEHNVYVNTTFKSTLSKGYTLFLGAANSIVYNTMDNALVANDTYNNLRNELHLKGRISNSFLNLYKFSFGVESYLRHSTKNYNVEQNLSHNYHLNYKIAAAFLDNQLKMAKGFYFNFSGRIEYADYNKSWNFMPRASISYIPMNKIQLTAMYGLYSQTTEDDILAINKNNMKQGIAEHMIVSFAYNTQEALIRIEPYYKKYRNLPLLFNKMYSSDGYGSSRGVDFYLEKENLLNNLKTSLSYSYNDSKRLYMEYPILSQPQYATNHNLNISLRYYVNRIKTYMGVSNSFASGRLYTNPNVQGFLNSKTPVYNSLDLNLTFLIKPNIILYTSVTNILKRNNIYNYNYSNTPNTNHTYTGVPIVASRDRFFFIGIFISLNNSKAYEISNF